MIGARHKLILVFTCLLLLAAMVDTVIAKPWRGIRPLRSRRAAVRRMLGKPLIGGEGSIDLYVLREGRVHVMYARRPCEEALPADWGNWRVARDTVVNISVTLSEQIPLKDLKIRNFERYKWYTGDSGATYYHDKRRGIEYQVQDGIVTAITYGPAAADQRLRCRKDEPLIRY